MSSEGRLLAVLLSLFAGACTDLNSVVFVTDTSIGINVDGKPPITSIAYDRTEGYFAPRYDNGAVPPVVASIGIGGTVFNPKIRQVYATGAAAVKAVNKPMAADGPYDLTGDASKKKLAFFGTSTTLGAKIGFGTNAPLPDSFVFGYRRKEFSFLPLGSTTVGGKQLDVYPSVLASIDTTLDATSVDNQGLNTIQFFSTGEAAETLAVNPTVQRAFEQIAKKSAVTTLPPDEQKQLISSNSDSSMKILSWLYPNRAVDQSHYDALQAWLDKQPEEFLHGYPAAAIATGDDAAGVFEKIRQRALNDADLKIPK